MLNRQGLHLLAEGTGGLEALHFEITSYIPLIVNCTPCCKSNLSNPDHAENIKWQLDPRVQSQNAAKKGVGRGQLLFLKGWQNTVLLFFTTPEQSPQLV